MLRTSSTGVSAVESVQVVDVDVLGAQAAQAGFTSLNQMMAGRSHVVRPFTQAERGLGRDQDILTASLDGFAENLLGEAIGVNIRGVEEINAGFQADGDEASSFGYIARAPGAKEFSSSAECASAKTECGYFQAGAAQLSEFHRK